MKYYKFSGLLQKEGWITPAYVGVNTAGIITYLSDSPPAQGIALESVLGLALPGFQNAHSHAFQYAMAGMAENHPVGTNDDFWTWREAMYQCALSVNPEQAEDIATMLYAEMLRVGYTHVAEFHYLHHDRDGKKFSDLAEMGKRMVIAAKRAGIKITLIPVFYQKGGFGQDPQPRQRRFISKSVEDFLKLFEASKGALTLYENSNLAISTHSLRAVDLKDIVATVDFANDIPFHMHVAEQKKEVEDCLAHCNRRPMQWVLENLPVDKRFHLVHSTHLSDEEIKGLAKSGASVVLCPSTEGNLGDGIFKMREFVSLGGRWSIGTDSHIGLNPLEEFRMIDYRQRLISNLRNTFPEDSASYMIDESVTSGRRAMGLVTSDHFETGKSFDAIIYDLKTPLLEAAAKENWLSTLVYSPGNNPLGTIVNGNWIVKQGRHHSTEISKRFKYSMKSLPRKIQS
ncbi:MAG: formimidoylglutamate deiminase [Flammeovirgaceae bacterium]|nr:formimidoylglutamate deiminase [Flammeovirgaceae bacterium]